MVTFQSEGAEANDTSQICLWPPGDGDFFTCGSCFTGSLVAADQTVVITSAVTRPQKAHRGRICHQKIPSPPPETRLSQKHVCKAFVSSKVSHGTKGTSCRGEALVKVERQPERGEDSAEH